MGSIQMCWRYVVTNVLAYEDTYSEVNGGGGESLVGERNVLKRGQDCAHETGEVTCFHKKKAAKMYETHAVGIGIRSRQAVQFAETHGGAKRLDC